MSDQLHVELAPQRLQVQPGSPAASQVRVVNLGEVVEEYELSLVGLPAGVARVEPARLSLLPEQEGQAQVMFDPTTGADLPAGGHVAGVRVASRSRPDVAYVAELSLQVAAVDQVLLEVSPQTLRAGGAGQLGVEVHNAGNRPVDITLRGRDDEGAVTFDFEPRGLHVEPGGRATSRLSVSASRAWTGAVRHRQLRIEAADAEAHATFVQKPVFSAGVLTALGALLSLLALGGIALCADGSCFGGDGSDEPVAVVTPSEETDDPTAEESESAAASPSEAESSADTSEEPAVDPVLVTVGDLVGSAGDEAVAALADAGLTLGGVVDGESLDVDPGVVLSQDPAPGTEVEEGTPVSLVVSAGPPPFEPGGGSAVVTDIAALAGVFTARGISCPGGQAVLGGGGGPLGEDLPDSLVMLRTGPGTLGGAASWATGFRNEGAEVAVRFSVLCGSAPEGYQQRSDDVELGPGQLRAHVVACPAGTNAISGGAAVIAEGSADHGVVLRQSGPGGAVAGPSAWVTVAENLDGAAHTLRFHAVCVAPGATFSVETTEVELAPGEVDRRLAVCPDGRRVLGGGVVVDDPAPGLVRTLVAESTPGTVRGGPADAWRATLRSNDEIPRRMVVSAVCDG